MRLTLVFVGPIDVVDLCGSAPLGLFKISGRPVFGIGSGIGAFNLLKQKLIQQLRIGSALFQISQENVVQGNESYDGLVFNSI